MAKKHLFPIVACGFALPLDINKQFDFLYNKGTHREIYKLMLHCLSMHIFKYRH